MSTDLPSSNSGKVDADLQSFNDRRAYTYIAEMFCICGSRVMIHGVRGSCFPGIGMADMASQGRSPLKSPGRRHIALSP